MLTGIELAKDVKRQIESVPCQKCGGAMLTFKSVFFDDGFAFKKGESMVVDAHCIACKSDPAIILEIKEDGHFG